MNLQGRFYVRSNYIRATKDDWVLCDVRLLADESDTFLCIKSIPVGVTTPEDDNKSTLSGLTGFSMFSSSTQAQSFRPFTALCNLSEYKSCSMRTVSVKDQAYFALKLVPSGALSNKRLLIAIADENEVTTWLASCKMCIGKKNRGGTPQPSRDNGITAGTLSKAGSLCTLKPEHGTPLEIEFDETLLDNEVYEAYSADDVIPAVVEEAGDWAKLQLYRADCYLRLKEERLELLDGISQKLLHWFPYLFIRRFGAANGVLRVDAGRRCSTGDGRFFFRCSPPNGQPVDALVTQIRQLALEAKQRLKQAQMTKSSIELNLHNSATSDLAGFPPRNGTDLMSTSITVAANLSSADADDNRHATLPKQSEKNTTRPAAALPIIRDRHRSDKPATNPTSENSDGQQQSYRRRSSSNTGEDDVFKAVPYRVKKQETDHSAIPGIYDNLPRHPRSKIRPVGGVNVLPLPMRTRPPSDQSAGSGDSISRLSTTRPSPPPSPTSSRARARSGSPVLPRKSVPSESGAAINLPLAPRTPSETEGWGAKSAVSASRAAVIAETEIEPSEQVNPSPTPTQRSTTSSGYQQPIVRSLSHPPPPIVPGATPAAVMRVPPLTAPKPRVSNPASANTKGFPSTENKEEESQNRDSLNSYPVTLSHLLNPKTSSAMMYLQAPHPGSKSAVGNGCCSPTDLTITPLSAGKIDNTERSSVGSGLFNDSKDGHEETRVSVVDPRNYLTELDTVIRELCEANEAAVQATKEAARRRHQLGWPPHFRSRIKEGEEEPPMVVNGKISLTKS